MPQGPRQWLLPHVLLMHLPLPAPRPTSWTLDTGVASDASGVISDAEQNAISLGPGMPSLSVPLPSLSPSSNPASDPILGAQPHAPSVFPPAYSTSTTLTPVHHSYLCLIRHVVHFPTPSESLLLPVNFMSPALTPTKNSPK